MWAKSTLSFHAKGDKINSFISWEISFIRLWQAQPKESVDTKGNSESGEDLLSTLQKFLIDEWEKAPVMVLAEARSMLKIVFCRFLTHLAHPQVHFQFGSFSGHRHINGIMVGTNKKYSVNIGIRNKSDRELILWNRMLFLISPGLKRNRLVKLVRKKVAVCIIS